jgi:ribosomal protein S11
MIERGITMKKTLSYILILTMLVAMTPPGILPVGLSTVEAAAQDLGQMNALDALGIDTTVMPEGFDPNSLDNPYGRDHITINPVYELFVTGASGTAIENILFGHNKALKKPMSDFYSSQGNQTTPAASFNVLAATASASGNFIGSHEGSSAIGKTGQVVTVGVGSLDKNGGLYLYFTDPVTGAISNEPKTLVSTDRIIGNTGERMDEDFAGSPILMQNFLQIATGDFVGDGIDEVAVYVAEQGNSRVEIYKLQTTDTSGDDFYLDPDHWSKVWTYYFNESPYVSNMVSLTAGDLNRNGIDDLALTWGYYYGPNQNSGSQAVVLYGDNRNMFQKKKNISLTYDTAPIVRASFAYGDITGDSVPELILGGQLHTDIAAGNLNSRFVAVYVYDGFSDSFIMVSARNFNLFEKKNNQYIHAAMANRGDRFYSSPASVANVTSFNPYGVGESAYIYLDSLLIKYGDEGLDISEALDQNQAFNKQIITIPQKYYMEYGAFAADFTGDAKESLQTMQYYASTTHTYTVRPSWWWWYWWLPETTDVYPALLHQLGLYKNEYGVWNVHRLQGRDFSTSMTKLNTDTDTALLSYTGVHYITYSDPKVLAVLASPPYFADLDNDELSGSYMDSQTSYSSSTGTGDGETTSHTLKAGAYMSFQHDFTVPVTGTKVGSFETELAYTTNLTWESANSSMLEQAITYSTSAGSDAVAFYSIPVETYVYDSMVPIIDEATGVISGYDRQKMSRNIPHVASVRVLPLDKYERIAMDYAELPQISGDILTHRVGVPSSYPSSTAGFNRPIAYKGDPAGVDFGGGSITQEISMTRQSEESFTHSHAVDFKIGGGPGNWVFGITAGYEYGSSRVEITTSGNTYTGQVNNMPMEAQPYNYNYAWKVFTYEYVEGKWVLGPGLLPLFEGTRFPVVSYLVTGVSSPPRLPLDFHQEIEKTTDDSITLRWSYNGSAAGFQLYRYYEFPDGSGSYELAFVPATAPMEPVEGIRHYTDVATGTRYYEFDDTGLNPYTEYAYQIQTVGASQPTHSIPSRVYRFKTKTDVGYPSLSLTGLTNGKLPILYPDSEHTVGVVINNMSDYTQPPKYQWQKLSEDGWQNILGAVNPTYRFRSVGLADEGVYRCRVNVIYGEYHISDYTEAFTLNYAKRTPQVRSFGVADATGENKNIPKIDISISSQHLNHFYRPTGVVVFEVVGADYRQSFPVALEPSIIDGESKASITLDHALPDGAYEINAFYTGSRVYQSLLTRNPIMYLAGEGSGYVLTLDSSYVYGENILPSVTKVVKDEETTEPVDIEGDISYEVVRYGWVYNSEIEDYEWKPSIIEGFVDNGSVTAYRTGDEYWMMASVEGEVVATRRFSVAPKELVIGIINQQQMAGNVSLKHPGIEVLTLDPETSFAYEDTMADLGLEVRVINTAGTEIQISSATDPGYYEMIGRPTSQSTDSITYHNYYITYKPGVYILTGPTFSVLGTARMLSDKIVGTIELLIPESSTDWSKEYSGGTSLVFLAKPNVGYNVKNWTIRDSATQQIIATAGRTTTLHHTMRAQDIEVIVEFEVAQKRLEYRVTGNGSITCISNTVMKSGDVAMEGAEFTFKATPAPGYHFSEWQLHEIGKTPIKPVGIPGEDGTYTCDVVMGTGDTVLYALFSRDSYELILEGDLKAGYWLDVDLGKEWRNAFSDDRIIGDTAVTVTPKPGYSLADDAAWMHDGEIATTGISSDGQSYTFSMMADTVIGAQTQAGSFDVHLQVEGPGQTENEVIVTVNDVQVSAGDLTDITGGSSLKLIAKPAYGYVFDKWIYNDADITGEMLNIAALGGDIVVKAVFKDNDDFVVSVNHGLRGSLQYSLNEGPVTQLPSSGDISVFAGDKVKIIATPETNFMVEQWWVDDVLYQSTARTRTFEDIVSNIDVVVVFGAQTYSTVTYTSGDNGTILSAKSDGVAFESGSNSVGNGSELVFIAGPDEGMMVDEWRLNGAIVENDFGQPFVGTTYIIPALSGNTNVSVTFKEIVTHMIQIEDNNTTTELTCSPDSALVDDGTDQWIQHGATVTFSVKPHPGFAIKSVTVTDITDEEGLIDFNSIVKKDDDTWLCVVGSVTSDIQVIATAQRLYSVTVPVIPTGGSVSVSSDHALAGDLITLTATPASSSYRFTGWSVNDGDVIVSDESASTTTFVMPESDVTVEAEFTFSGGGGDSGGGGGGGIVIIDIPEYTLLADGTVLVTLNDEMTSISDKLNETLIDLNKTKAIIISGNGVRILIPAGTLKPGSDANNLIPDLTSALGKPGEVVVYTDASGRLRIVKWSLIGVNEASFIVEGIGKYSIVDNSKTFKDIDGHWGQGAISFVTARELFMGTSEIEFSADAPMTRAMLVTVLHRLDGLVVTAGESFNDVEDGLWYSEAVAWAASNGIVGGYGDGTFGTDDNITREQLATILYRYAETKGIAGNLSGNLSEFSDSNIVSSYALEAMEWAIGAGIISGRNGKLLDPKANASRAEVAVILQRLVDMVL